jgi:prepilin peptidase CpaA
MTLYWTLTLVVTAALTDMRSGHIPNWLTALAFASGLVVHGVAGAMDGGASAAAIAVAWSLAGALICIAPVLLLFARGAMGGGDLKLFAAVGALLHPMRGLEVEVYAFVVAMIVALGQIVHRGVLVQTIVRSASMFLRPLRANGEGPAAVTPHLLVWFRLGPSIFAGALASWFLRHH